MRKKIIAMLLGILLILIACRTETDYVEKEEAKQSFAVFSATSSNKVAYKKNAKTGNNQIDYASGFAYLLQRHDSIHHKNNTGLVNSSNETIWDDEVKQHFIKKSSSAFIEFRIKSQTVVQENQDKWVVFPKIENGKVIDLVGVVLSDSETDVRYYYIDRESEFYKDNVSLFQEKYNKYFTKSNRTAANRDAPDRDIDGVEIVFSTKPWWDLGKESTKGDTGTSGGGKCTEYDDCDQYDRAGGGGDVTQEKDPCAKVKNNNRDAKNLISKADVKNKKENILKDIKTDTNEKSFSFGKDKDGNYKTTEIKTGTSGNSVGVTITSPTLTIEAGVHTHTTSLFDCFSAGDFYALHGANTANSNFKNYYVFAEDAAYVMTITNPSKFKNFTKNFPQSEYFDSTTGDWKNDTSIYNSFDNSYQQFLKSGMDEDLAFEYATALIMTKYDMGIAISKQDSLGNFNTVFVKENKIPIQISPGIFINISHYEKTEDCNLK